MDGGNRDDAAGTDRARKRKEIYMLDLPWAANGLSWSMRADRPFRLAVSSYMEEYQNRVNIVQLDDETDQLVTRAHFDHPYPATKIMWLPDQRTNATDLLATTGDYLRLWEVNPRNKDGEIEEGRVVTSCCLNNNKKTDFCAPLTSFDWNSTDARYVGTASIDTTCSVWDIEAQRSLTQLIAHEKEVYDIAFGEGSNVFASVGGDGSVRLFDLRSLEHSTIVYETEDCAPLLRVVWNKQESNYLATVRLDSSDIVILDVRRPSVAVKVLSHCQSPVNSIGWAPHSSCHLCSAGEDSHALIWEVTGANQQTTLPILAYAAKSHINWLQWSALQTDWIAITFGNNVEILRV
eukprot:TRINITY_DN20615_c0_g2_i1.p1 TRINITY_DN20615_c0_g2~~TRINITY_DN20615_c0_g2_i1.p1  ORF type:complete len:349 (+),score=46.27 TRINITY_DN20615_c0_g2_i1:36-1082(+)